MGFKRFVEIGRVAVISYGPDSGKLCTIVDVIDHNRVLVDGPAAITGVHRHELGINRIMLTDLKVAAKHNASHKCAPAHQFTPRGEYGLGRGAKRHAWPRSVPPAAPPRRQRPPFARARPQLSPSLLPPRNRRQLAALWKSEDVQGKWDATNWAKKIQKRKLRASMTDFDRFQVMLARKERSAARKAA
jgi:ribosomal protein L14E/L6E/L27E